VNHPTGQASTEYVAVLLVVAAVLATAAVAVPSIGDRVIAAVRTGVCIVGGDICRSADATAAGLDPCVTGARSTRQDTTLDIAVVRLGGHGEWLLALQSDGGAVVTRLEESEAGGTVGVGVSFTPVGLDAEARVALTVGYRSGRAWRFADAASAGAFLEGAMRDAAVQAARPPDVRWDAIAGAGDAEAGAAISGLAGAGLRTAAERVVGLRREGARRTLTVDMGSEAPTVAVDLPGFPGAPGERGSIVADVTWEGGQPLELALRTATESEGRLEEVRGRLDLRDPVNRALADRLLVPGDVREALAGLAARIASHGVVERSGYTTTERRRGIGFAGRLGVSVGLSHERVTAERRLVDAVAWVRGGPPQRRLDCLGV
jgi:hypothetical protein